MEQPESGNLFEVFPVLQTDRLDLVEIGQSHLTDIFSLFSDDRVTKYYNIVTLKEEKDAQSYLDWFRNRFALKAGIRWGIVLKGTTKLIGTAGYNNFTTQHRANLGYDLHPDHWGHGYVTEALTAVIEFGFARLLVNRIEAEVMPGNIASEKVLNKLKFKKEGLLRQWMYWNGHHYDMIMFSLLWQDYRPKADKPATLDSRPL